MTRLEMEQCDGPKCKKFGEPESDRLGPYGWIEANIHTIGMQLPVIDRADMYESEAEVPETLVFCSFQCFYEQVQFAHQMWNDGEKK